MFNVVRLNGGFLRKNKDKLSFEKLRLCALRSQILSDVSRKKGRAELFVVRKKSHHLYWVVGIFSFFVNLLMLTGPIYMLNIYDRVLSSRSVETLFALSVMVAFLYAMMGVLDFVRGRVMGRVGARFQTDLDQRVFAAVLKATTINRAPKEAASGLKDLESIQRLITSPSLMALFDLPWVPLFFLGIFIFHPFMGVLAVGGAVFLLLIAFLNQRVARKPLEAQNAASLVAENIGAQIRSESEMIHSLGMRQAAFARWQIARGQSLDTTIEAADRSGAFAALTKAFRLFLQSAMLGLGAYLVLIDQVTPGAIIAAAILLGRALSPIELLVGQWPLFQRASEGWNNLSVLLGQIPADISYTALPKPQARIAVEQVTIVPPRARLPALRAISFEVVSGQAVGVIGVSGCGKSTLARAITGVWHPAVGSIRLDGAALDQYDSNILGQYIGYLPQRVQLFDGTIKNNIARMALVADDQAVIKAAKTAAAHEMILRLPAGYDTQVSAQTSHLSGGQIQRVGLARALYGDPVVVVLDEPNSNLDNEGSNALNTAIRTLKTEGKIVFIMAHRPSAIQECDLLLILEDGVQRAFGTRDAVLAEMVRNHGEIKRSAGSAGGVS